MELGLCCLYDDSKLKFRTITMKNYSKFVHKVRKFKLEDIWLHNTQVLYSYVVKAIELNIKSFRVSSNLFPMYNVDYTLNDLKNEVLINNNLVKTRVLAERHNIKLSLHPDQFCVLTSKNKNVIKNSISILEYHHVLAKLLNINTITIHTGGVYAKKDINKAKQIALKTFCENASTLDPDLVRRLTIENCQKYCIGDLLYINEKLDIPITLDIHHHRINPGLLTIEEATKTAINTWRNRKPHFHISSPKNGWSSKDINSHADYIDINDFPEFWGKLDIYVDVEAKKKEKALLKLRGGL